MQLSKGFLKEEHNNCLSAIQRKEISHRIVKKIGKQFDTMFDVIFFKFFYLSSKQFILPNII
jgi:hypothetical protein